MSQTMKYIYLLSILLCVSCQSRQQVTSPTCTIDSTLQTNAIAILGSIQGGGAQLQGVPQQGC